MDSYNKFGIVHCIYPAVSGYNFQGIIMFFCLNIYATLSNSVDPDEMRHCAAFHLGLHCLQKYIFMGFPEYRGLIWSRYVTNGNNRETATL